jgi:hypothetical protein
MDNEGDSTDPRVEAAGRRAWRLYEGVETPHRSCGIAIAETFGRPTAPYQSLRKGGLTGCGECGAVVAGRLLLGEFLGDPDPTGAVTPALREGMVEFEALWRERLDRGEVSGEGIVCNDLTGQFADFEGPDRHAFCTRLAAGVAEVVALVALRHGVEWKGEVGS